jgi:hypothetical protein
MLLHVGTSLAATLHSSAVPSTRLGFRMQIMEPNDFNVDLEVRRMLLECSSPTAYRMTDGKGVAGPCLRR